MFPSILTFDSGVHSCSLTTFIFYDFLNAGVVFVLWGPNGLVWGSEQGLTTVLGSTHVVEQLSFSMFPLNLSFYFDLMLGPFLLFVALMGSFGVGV